MYVIAVEPNKKAHTRIIDDDLNALQKAVGGNIETIYLNEIGRASCRERV